MIAGEIFSTSLYELPLTVSGTLEDDGDDSQLVTYRGENYTRFQAIGGTVLGMSIILSTEYARDGVSTHGVRFQIPAIAVDSSFSDNSLAIGQSARIEIDDLQVFAVEGFFGKTFFTTWTEIRLIWNGVTEQTIGGDGVLGTILTGTSPPLLGEPSTISSGCGPGIPLWANWATVVAAEDLDLSGTHSSTGGARFKDEGGNWVTFPVAVPGAPGFNNTGPFRPAPGSFDITDTGSATVSSSFQLRYYGVEEGPFECTECPPGTTLVTPGTYTISRTFGSYDFKDAELMLVPNVARHVAKYGDSYMAVWRRGGFPWTRTSAVSSWETHDRETVCGEVVSDNHLDNSGFIVHSERPSMRRCVGSTPNEIEDVLSSTPYSPYRVGQAVREFQNAIYTPFDPGFCSEPGNPIGVTPECCPEEPHYSHKATYTRSFPEVGPVPAGGYLGLSSSDQVTKYLNFWGNPVWSYHYDFPEDSDPLHWWAQGAKRSSSEYWIPIRQQWAGGLFLPARNARGTRNFLVSPPLDTGAFAGHIASSYFPVPTSWVGICRFDNLPIPTTSLTLDSTSEPNFSATNATLTFGSDIEIDPSDTIVTIDLDLVTFTDSPFCGTLNKGSVTYEFDPANINSVSVQLVGAGGDTVEIATGLSGTAQFLPAADSEYAGTWAQDHANGEIDDEGEDIAAGGESVTVLGSPERVHSFQYLIGETAQALRFVVEVASTSSNCNMEYPVFSSAGNPTVVQETGIGAVQLYPNGPGVRYGQWDFWDSGGEEVRETPTVRPIGETPTVLDFLCYRNLLNGNPSDFGLAALIASLYDPLEGDEEEDIASTCHSFAVGTEAVDPAPTIGVLVNSWREVPPIIALPHPFVGIGSIVAAGYTNVTHSFCQERRYLISPAQPMHLDEVDGPRWTTSSPAPAGWFITGHDRRVTNNESPGDFRVVTDEPYKVWADATPFNGYFANLNHVPQGGEGPWNMVDFEGRYHVAYSSEGQILYRRAAQIAPLPSWQISVVAAEAEGAAKPRMAQDSKTLRILLVFDSTSGPQEIYSDDGGASWSEPEAMAITGGERVTISTGDGGVVRAAVVPGTPNTIGATWQGPGDQSQSSVFTFEDDGGNDLEVADGQFHLVHSGELNDRWLLEVVIDGESAPSSWWSDDSCRSWRRF